MYLSQRFTLAECTILSLAAMFLPFQPKSHFGIVSESCFIVEVCKLLHKDTCIHPDLNPEKVDCPALILMLEAIFIKRNVSGNNNSCETPQKWHKYVSNILLHVTTFICISQIAALSAIMFLTTFLLTGSLFFMQNASEVT